MAAQAQVKKSQELQNVESLNSDFQQLKSKKNLSDQDWQKIDVIRRQALNNVTGITDRPAQELALKLFFEIISFTQSRLEPKVAGGGSLSQQELNMIQGDINDPKNHPGIISELQVIAALSQSTQWIGDWLTSNGPNTILIPAAQCRRVSDGMERILIESILNNAEETYNRAMAGISDPKNVSIVVIAPFADDAYASFAALSRYRHETMVSDASMPQALRYNRDRAIYLRQEVMTDDQKARYERLYQDYDVEFRRALQKKVDSFGDFAAIQSGASKLLAKKGDWKMDDINEFVKLCNRYEFYNESHNVFRWMSERQNKEARNAFTSLNECYNQFLGVLSAKMKAIGTVGVSPGQSDQIAYYNHMVDLVWRSYLKADPKSKNPLGEQESARQDAAAAEEGIVSSDLLAKRHAGPDAVTEFSTMGAEVTRLTVTPPVTSVSLSGSQFKLSTGTVSIPPDVLAYATTDPTRFMNLLNSGNTQSLGEAIGLFDRTYLMNNDVGPGLSSSEVDQLYRIGNQLASAKTPEELRKAEQALMNFLNEHPNLRGLLDVSSFINNFTGSSSCSQRVLLTPGFVFNYDRKFGVGFGYMIDVPITYYQNWTEQDVMDSSGSISSSQSSPTSNSKRTGEATGYWAQVMVGLDQNGLPIPGTITLKYGQAEGESENPFTQEKVKINTTLYEVRWENNPEEAVSLVGGLMNLATMGSHYETDPKTGRRIPRPGAYAFFLPDNVTVQKIEREYGSTWMAEVNKTILDSREIEALNKSRWFFTVGAGVNVAYAEPVNGVESDMVWSPILTGTVGERQGKFTWTSSVQMTQVPMLDGKKEDFYTVSSEIGGVIVNKPNYKIKLSVFGSTILPQEVEGIYSGGLKLTIIPTKEEEEKKKRK